MLNHNELEEERLGEAIMNIVIDDITGRRGLRQEWERIDTEIQDEVKDTLWRKIAVALKADRGTSLEELRILARRVGQ